MKNISKWNEMFMDYVEDLYLRDRRKGKILSQDVETLLDIMAERVSEESEPPAFDGDVIKIKNHLKKLLDNEFNEKRTTLN